MKFSAKKNSSGTQLALGVAALFAASCESPSPAGKPDSPTTTAKAKPDDKNAADSKPGEKKAVAARVSGAMPSGTMPGHKSADPTIKTVNCLGIHECKGKSACHVKEGHACAGQNDCKGKGWIVVPEADCEAKGGKAIEI